MPSLVLSVRPGSDPYATQQPGVAALSANSMNKVPQITFAFWVMNDDARRDCWRPLVDDAGYRLCGQQPHPDQRFCRDAVGPADVEVLSPLPLLDRHPVDQHGRDDHVG